MGGGKADRRTADRTRRRYPIAWLRGGALVPALGLEISEKGVLFATREAPPGRIVDVFEWIAADDWDAVVRFCKNFNAPTNKAA